MPIVSSHRSHSTASHVQTGREIDRSPTPKYNGGAREGHTQMLVTTRPHGRPPDAPTPMPPAQTAAPASPRAALRARWRTLLHWARLVALYTLALAGLATALGPIGPSMDDYLAAAKAARAALRYD